MGQQQEGTRGRGTQRRGAVPLARRLAEGERRRMLSGCLAVALAITLVLLVEGLSAGVDERIVTFERRSGADLYVAQSGTTSLLGSTSILPSDVVRIAQETPGVRSATPMRGLFTIAAAGDASLPTYLVGAPTGAPGRPWSLAEGRAPVGLDEIVLAEHAARRVGLDVGGTVQVLGAELEVVGLAADADLFMASFAYLTHDASDALLHAPGTTSFVLVQADDPAATREALEAAGLYVRSPEELMAADLALKSGAYSAALGLLVAVAVIVCILVVGLTIYGGVVAQARSFGVLKALGARRSRLVRVVLLQSVTMAAGGVALGAVLYGLGRRVLATVHPEMAVQLTLGSAARAAVLAACIGVAAAWIPVRRLAAVAPAGAFGGTS